MAKTERRAQAERQEQSGGQDEAAASGAGSPDRVEDAILGGIRAGHFFPGQHLVEAELTQRLGVSRGSLREGFRRLAAAGIITISRHRGAYISRLNSKALNDLLLVLERLAGLAAELAASRSLNAKQTAALKAAAKRLTLYYEGGGRTEFIADRRKFYNVLIHLSGNEELARVIPLARTELFRSQSESFYSPKGRARHIDDLIGVEQAVLKADPRAALRAMQRHFRHLRELVDSLPDDAFGNAN